MKNKTFSILILLIISMLILTVFGGYTNAATNMKEPIPFDDEISYIENEDGTLTVCKANVNITNATIPESINGKKVTRIGDFWECSNLKSISIPNTVTSIRQGAFADCTSLESIVIPDSVTEIDMKHF